jgi:hypothetical protein
MASQADPLLAFNIEYLRTRQDRRNSWDLGMIYESAAGVTQFGRALLALNIDITCTNSPQAKGRIERAFRTLQDRMVKELRLVGLSSMAAANAWLPGFITAYSTRFGRASMNAEDLHRPLTPADDLDSRRSGASWSFGPTIFKRSGLKRLRKSRASRSIQAGCKPEANGSH